MNRWTHTWAWSKRPIDRNRKGQRCRVLATGSLGTAHVEFEDGTRHFTSRRGLRRLPAPAFVLTEGSVEADP